MAYTWQTVEEAALALKCSTRTINRRVKDGAIESRLNAGRREVLICIPDEPASPPTLTAAPPPAMDQAAVDTAEAVRHAAGVVARAMPDDQAALEHEQARRTELALSAFRQTLSICQAEVARARSGARLAWAAVMVLAIVLYIAVGWTAGMVSRANTQRDHLADQVKALADLSERSRQEAAAAVEARARLEGELSALRHARLAKDNPTTRPGLLAWLFNGSVGQE